MLFRLTALACCALVLTAGDSLSNHLKKDVYYLASDKMKGRGQGTPELERAGEFIAQRFWKIGLQPASAGGWFQAVPVHAAEIEDIEIHIDAGASKFTLTRENATTMEPIAVDLSGAPVVKVNRSYAAKLKPGELEGKIAVATESTRGRITAARPRLAILASGSTAKMANMMPSVIPTLRYEDGSHDHGSVPTLLTDDPDLTKWIESQKTGPVADATSSGHITVENREIDLHNVIGMLPGSDPVLKDTYVIVSAHYDHLGEAPSGGPDRIRNGANDDASGTATMLEVASAIAKMKDHPKRTILFAAWTGEEAGGLGSKFYAAHPLFPLSKTVANINIEQDGRYDGENGSGPKRLFVTGYGYSDIGKLATAAAKPTGVEVYAGPDDFFARSDNFFLAEAGVPAHTIGSSLEFPDYHKVTDSPEKLDYENMALLTKAIAAVVADLADSEHEPRWKEERATAPYRKARAASATPAPGN